jgi:hypothetical protein
VAGVEPMSDEGDDEDLVVFTAAEARARVLSGTDG